MRGDGTGHASDSKLERYNIVATEDTLDALKRREAALQREPETDNVTPLGHANTDNSPTNSL